MEVGTLVHNVMHNYKLKEDKIIVFVYSCIIPGYSLNDTCCVCKENDATNDEKI